MDVDWSKVKSAIGTVAPWLAATLGSPVAGVAVKSLCGILGLDANQATPDAMLTAVASATPQQLQAIRAEDNRHSEFMAQIGYNNLATLEATAAADRASARGREVGLAEAGQRDRTPAILAFMIIGGFFSLSIAEIAAVLGAAEYVAKVPPQGWLLIGNVSGYLAAEAKAAAAYYFGTTAGSDKKTDIIAQAEPVNTGGGNG